MTIREYLNTLPDGYRELALKYEDRQLEDWDAEVGSMATTINRFVHWPETDEGMDFWGVVYHHFAAPPLPPLP